jgi:hypothetical protein
MDDEIEKPLSPIIKLDHLMVKNDTALPIYNFNMLKIDDWQVTCSIPSLAIEETISGSAKHEVRELVAEKVIGIIRDKGILNVKVR